MFLDSLNIEITAILREINIEIHEKLANKLRLV